MAVEGDEVPRTALAPTAVLFCLQAGTRQGTAGRVQNKALEPVRTLLRLRTSGAVCNTVACMLVPEKCRRPRILLIIM